MSNKKFKAKDIKDNLTDLEPGSTYVLVTGERGAFEIFNTLAGDPLLKVYPTREYNHSKEKGLTSMKLSCTRLYIEYNLSFIEIILSVTLDSREFCKVLANNGGIESSYDCYLMKYNKYEQ